MSGESYLIFWQMSNAMSRTVSPKQDDGREAKVGQMNAGVCRNGSLYSIDCLYIPYTRFFPRQPADRWNDRSFTQRHVTALEIPQDCIGEISWLGRYGRPHENVNVYRIWLWMVDKSYYVTAHSFFAHFKGWQKKESELNFKQKKYIQYKMN